MVTMSSRKSAGLDGRTLLVFITCFLFACGLFYSSNLQSRDMDIIAESIAVIPTATHWEHLEEQMQKLDPEKAQRWKAFLKGEASSSAVTTEKSVASSEASVYDLQEQLAEANSKLVRDWRQKFEAAAALENKEEHRRQTETLATDAFPVATLRKCQYVFLDFGANIGDSLVKLIDSSMPEYDSGVVEDGTKIHHILNTTTGSMGPTFYDHMKRNPNKWILPKWVNQNIEAYNKERKVKGNRDPVQPEDYCYYGVEGNPVFTSRLRREEIQVMNMIPRPVRHLHFLTEHVGAGKDGPTTLFLDTVNGKDNFWGSSILQSHVDVVKSGGNTGTPVMGITLTKLLKDTVLPGGHVMIKIDIEGGEYQLLEEAIDTDIFCKLIKKDDVKIDLLNEPHGANIVGSEEPGQRWKDIGGQNKIRNCGVGYNWKNRQFR
jgi:hypothetical protein